MLMACIAINGFHATASYTWAHDDVVMLSHQSPLLYCSAIGSYTCKITCKDSMICRFQVKGNLLFSICIIICIYYTESGSGLLSAKIDKVNSVCEAGTMVYFLLLIIIIF